VGLTTDAEIVDTLENHSSAISAVKSTSQNSRRDIMATLANTVNITNRSIAKRGITRTLFRWIHIVFAIPILGYIYSPFEKLPDYAFKTRFIFVPIMVLSGLWMWKGHLVRRLFLKTSR
jgi:hypothetical protein